MNSTMYMYLVIIFVFINNYFFLRNKEYTLGIYKRKLQIQNLKISLTRNMHTCIYLKTRLINTNTF